MLCDSFRNIVLYFAFYAEIISEIILLFRESLRYCLAITLKSRVVLSKFRIIRGIFA